MSRPRGFHGRWKTLRLWVGLAALSCILEAAHIVSESQFISRLGLGPLPAMFVLQALLRVLGSWVYFKLADGRSVRGTFLVLLLALGLLVGFPATLSAIHGSALWYAAVYAAVEAADTVIKIHWGIFLLSLLSPREAGLMLPVVYTAAAVGRASGGGLVRGAAATGLLAWSVPGLMAFLLPVAAASLLWARRRRPQKKAGPPKRPPARIPDPLRWLKPLPSSPESPRPLKTAPSMRRGLFQGEAPRPADRSLLAETIRLLWSSRLLQTLVVGTVLLVAVRLSGQYVELGLLRRALDARAMASVLGTFSAAANVTALAIQVFVVPRLAAKGGPQRPTLVHAASLLLAALLLPWGPAVAAALAFRFARLQFKAAVRTPVAPMYYYPFEPRLRPGARALVLGLVSPLATALVAGATKLLGGGLALQTLGCLTGLLAAGYLVMAVLQNRAYRRAMGGSSATRASGP